jgi:hypothetical protein
MQRFGGALDVSQAPLRDRPLPGGADVVDLHAQLRNHRRLSRPLQRLLARLEPGRIVRAMLIARSRAFLLILLELGDGVLPDQLMEVIAARSCAPQ